MFGRPIVPSKSSTSSTSVDLNKQLLSSWQELLMEGISVGLRRFVTVRTTEITSSLLFTLVVVSLKKVVK